METKTKQHIKAIREAFEAAIRDTGDLSFKDQLNDFLTDWGFVKCDCCDELSDEYRVDADEEITCEKCVDDLETKKELNSWILNGGY